VQQLNALAILSTCIWQRQDVTGVHGSACTSSCTLQPHCSVDYHIKNYANLTSHTACRRAWACVVMFHHHHIKIEDPVITAARAPVWLKDAVHCKVLLFMP
jgi:hypothetical protein